MCCYPTYNIYGWGGTAGNSRGTGSCFSLSASLLSDVPCIGCDLVGYLQWEWFLLSNWGTPLASCGPKNPATPLPHLSQVQHYQQPPLLTWCPLWKQSLWPLQSLRWFPETGVHCALNVHGVLGSCRQCALACYSCNRSKGDSWTSYSLSPWVAALWPTCCWGVGGEWMEGGAEGVGVAEVLGLWQGS